MEQPDKTETEKLMEAREKIKALIPQDRLVINRIPIDTKREFIEYAKENFCDDYGQCLKAIWDYYKLDVKYTDLLDRVRAIEDALTEAILAVDPVGETAQKIDTSNSVTLLSGKIIKKKE